MKIKSFGCSFIFGSDLRDCDLDPPWPKGSKSTWPALLAQKLNATYECHAWPGTGNLRIAESVLKQISMTDQSFFLIGWTWIDRFDYVGLANNQWSTILPSDVDPQSELYYKHLHSEYRDKLTNLINIRLVIEQLQSAQIPFLMTYLDKLLFDQRWHVNPAIIKLQNEIKPYMTLFNGQTFLEWSRSHGYAESQLWHPLEEAHEAAADYMFKVFDKQKTNDPVL